MAVGHQCFGFSPIGACWYLDIAHGSARVASPRIGRPAPTQRTVHGRLGVSPSNFELSEMKPRSELFNSIVSCGIETFLPPSANRLAVLMYHSVGSDRPASLPAALFAKHLAHLQQRTDIEILNWRHIQSLDASKRQALITFDDGYLDNYEIAAPVLDRVGAKGLFFVTTAFLEGDIDITENFKNYKGLPPMRWDHVCELLESGHAVGLHGHSHRNFAAMSFAEAQDEMARSAHIFQTRTGVQANTFAYPFGQYAQRRPDIFEICAELQIKYIFTTDNRTADLSLLTEQSTSPVLIPRLRVDAYDSGDTVGSKVRGAWNHVAAGQRLKMAIHMRSASVLVRHDR